MVRHFHNQHRFLTRLPILIFIIFLLISVNEHVAADTDTSADPVIDFIKGDLPDNFTITSIPKDDNLQSIDSHRIETFSINMPQLEGREKDIILYFPSDYLISENTYPVIYLQNAENVFLYNGYGNESWSLNEDLYKFHTSDLESEAIIVGIESDPIYFWEEYGPWVNENMYLWMDPYEANRVEGGKGDAYLDFLIQTLKPEIDKRYRTLPDQENTSIAGSKMGGLISLYAGLTRSDVFSKVKAMSPSIWFAEQGGTWLSNNHLLESINAEGAPKNVTFSIDVAEVDRTTDLEVRPVVDDSRGNKISFPQAYLEGTQSFVTEMVHAGQSINDIKGGLANPDEWIDEYAERTTILNDLDFINYLPLFLTPKIPPEITSEAATTFLIDHNNEFIIRSTGGPIPTISFTGALPQGVNFIENGDGTATLSGTPTGPSGIYTINLTAENGVTPPATQYFKLRITDQAVCEGDIGCFYDFDMSMNPYLDRTRTIHVYLPPHYDPDGEGYQVIYLTSAENLFGDEVGAYTSNDWDFDETLNDLYDQTGKGTIAVGLEYDFHYPWDEYTLWNNNNMDNWVTNVTVLTGKGSSYLNFIVSTLKPIIDTSYNTLPDSENTAFGGGSRNALFALCAGLKHPETFSKVMAFSPAIWIAEGSGKLPLGQPVWFSSNQLGYWIDSHGVPSDVEFFLHTGTNEWQGTGGDYPYAYTSNGTKLEWKDVYKNGAVKIATKLDLDSVHFQVITGGSHTPSVWSEFVDDALQVLGFYP